MPNARILRGLSAVSSAPPRAVATVGVFDGVHRAHQQLVRTTVRMARRLRGTSVVITFDPDPQHVLDPAHEHPALMPLPARLMRLASLGADWIWVVPFTKRFAHLRAEAFVRRVLLGRLRARAVVVGERFAFGAGREGDLAILRALGAAHGMRVIPVREVTHAGAPVSSSRIRRAIAAGDLRAARALLGCPPTLYGTVVRGVGRGKRLGAPTANLRLTSQVVPPRGVYAVTVQGLATRRPWPGVMNLGVRPTFGAGALVCEVHLLGFSGDILGQSIEVTLLARLREERRFPSIEALRRQIQRDLRAARRLLTRLL